MRGHVESVERHTEDSRGSVDIRRDWRAPLVQTTHDIRMARPPGEDKQPTLPADLREKAKGWLALEKAKRGCCVFKNAKLVAAASGLTRFVGSPKKNLMRRLQRVVCPSVGKNGRRERKESMSCGPVDTKLWKWREWSL